MEDKNKYYFFRELSNQDNLENGKTFHAAGLVINFYCQLESPNVSGKDMSVKYIHPYRGTLECVWMSVSEVELFEVDFWEWEKLMSFYNNTFKDRVT